MESIRAKQIDDYIKAGKEANIQPVGISSIIIEDERRDEPVYEIPIDLLRFNIDNGRFLAEKINKNKKLGFELDSDNKDHEIYFLELLLPEKDPESKKLVNDIKNSGQLVPGVITYDGYVVDGNRRMAALIKLYKETKKAKFEKLRVHRLPPTINPKNIYIIEIEHQLKKVGPKSYGPINEMLKIKEGTEKGLTVEEIANRIDWSENKIKESFSRLRMMDYFLTKIGKSEDYSILTNYNEHFVELMKGKDKLEREGSSAIDIDDYMEIFFKAMEANIDNSFDKVLGHRGPLRNLPEAFLDKTINPELKELINPEKNPTSEEIFKIIKNASDAIEFIKTNKKPIELLRQARVLIEKIDINSDMIFETQFINLLNAVGSTLQRFREKIINP